MKRFQAAKLIDPWYAVVTHSGKSVVLLGKSQVPKLEFQMQRAPIPICDSSKVEILISTFSPGI